MKRKLFSLFLATVAFAPTVGTAGAKAPALSDVEERRWIATVKQHRTADGRTVAEVLATVEKQARGRFKVASYDVLYDWQGVPKEVAISYWIGTKRARDLTFADLAYPMNRDGSIGRISVADHPEVAALEKGAASMLSNVEEHYRRDCSADMPSDHC